MSGGERFDAAYFNRFYRNPKTRVATPGEVRAQANFIASFLRYLDVPVRSILDIGCGLGHLLNALGAAFPRARTEGVEASSYLCETLGWRRGVLPDYAPPRPFDLVVCHDVVAYLDDAAAAKALAVLGRASRRALFFAALTTEDRAACDERRTDFDVHLRPNAWYRRRLGRWFEPIGGGLWLRRSEPAKLWSLDRR